MSVHRQRCRILPAGVTDAVARSGNLHRTAGVAGMPIQATCSTEGLCKTYTFIKRNDITYEKRKEIPPNNFKRGYRLARSFIEASLGVEIPIESRLERDVPYKKRNIPSKKSVASAYGKSIGTGCFSHPTITRKYYEIKPLTIEYHTSRYPSFMNYCLASLFLSRNQCDDILPVTKRFTVLECRHEKARKVEDLR
jgi:hypothetical protein